MRYFIQPNFKDISPNSFNTGSSLPFPTLFPFISSLVFQPATAAKEDTLPTSGGDTGEVPKRTERTEGTGGNDKVRRRTMEVLVCRLNYNRSRYSTAPS